MKKQTKNPIMFVLKYRAYSPPLYHFRERTRCLRVHQCFLTKVCDYPDTEASIPQNTHRHTHTNINTQTPTHAQTVTGTRAHTHTHRHTQTPRATFAPNHPSLPCPLSIPWWPSAHVTLRRMSINLSYGFPN